METGRRHPSTSRGGILVATLVLVGLAGPSVVRAQNPPGYRGDRTVVSRYRAEALARFQDLLGRWFEAVQAQDAAGATSYYGAVSTLHLNGVATGPAEIEPVLTDWLGSFERLDWGLREFQISGSIAYASVNLIAHGLHDADESVGSMLVIMEVDGSGWEIRYHSIVLPRPRLESRAEAFAVLLEELGIDDTYAEGYRTAMQASPSGAGRADLLTRLLGQDPLTAGDRAELVAAILDSDPLQLGLLARLADLGLGDEAVHRAFFDIAANLDSDRIYEQAMRLVADREDPRRQDLVVVLEHAAADLQSDFYLADLVTYMAARHPPTGVLGNAYLGALDAIHDDYNYGRAARAILGAGLASNGTIIAVLDHAQGAMASEHWLSELLLFALERHPPDGALDDAYVRALESLETDYERGRVAESLFRAGRDGSGS